MKTTTLILIGFSLAFSARAQVVPPATPLFGKTLEEYSVEFMRFNFSLSTNQDPVHLLAGSLGEPVYFIALDMFGAPGQEKVFTVPENAYVLYPIVVGWADNVDTDPRFTVEALRGFLAEFFDSIIAIDGAIDDQPIPNLLDHRVNTPVFTFDFQNPDNLYSRIYSRDFLGAVDPIVADGYWVMAEPLPVGRHDLTYQYTLLPPLGSQPLAVFHFDVVPVPPSEWVRDLANVLHRLETTGFEVRTLLQSLAGAQAHFEAGRMAQGIRRLTVFQRHVEHRLASGHAGLAEDLSSYAERIKQRTLQEP